MKGWEGGVRGKGLVGERERGRGEGGGREEVTAGRNEEKGERESGRRGRGRRGRG